MTIDWEHMPTSITVPDGYNGHTVTLDTTPLEQNGQLVKLAVVGKPWLIRWVRVEDLGRTS